MHFQFDHFKILLIFLVEGAVIHKGATFANFTTLKSQEAMPNVLIFPKTKSSNLFSTEQETTKVNPFTRLVTKPSESNLAKPVFWQAQQQPLTAAAEETVDSTKPEAKNLFEHLIKKNDQQDEAERKEKQLSLRTESFFQSMLLEKTREVVTEFYRSQQTCRNLELEMTNELVDSVVGSEIRQIFYEIVAVVKSEQEAERMRQQVEMEKRREGLVRFHQVGGSGTLYKFKEYCDKILKILLSRGTSSLSIVIVYLFNEF